MALKSGGSHEIVKGQDESHYCLQPSQVRDPTETYYLPWLKEMEHKLNIQ